MHFEHMARKISNYQLNIHCHEKSEEKTMARDVEFLKRIIHRHCLILELSERINDIFGISLFVNISTSVMVICFLGFQMSIGASALNLLKLISFLILMLTQGFLICHYGQQLTDAKKRKTPQILIPISRGTMTQVIQASYKFFTLLKTVYVK
ncbi:odorant receptor 85c-like [Musca vetustissima]|uniref:odorant receptor 85c-like n=1 Tax=Musca vetustissima TaxID=27455 RepID=UPI002AB6B151|nr:odorant receptor 85c-like [Musca vetustissima]